MRLPKPGEWWNHKGNYLTRIWNSKPIAFVIEEVVEKDDIDKSWIIYSNNDDTDYFVVTFEEFRKEWEIADGDS